MKTTLMVVAAVVLGLGACGGKGDAGHCKKYADKMAELGSAGAAAGAADSIRAGSLQRCKDGSVSKQQAECVAAAADTTAAAKCMVPSE